MKNKDGRGGDRDFQGSRRTYPVQGGRERAGEYHGQNFRGGRNDRDEYRGETADGTDRAKRYSGERRDEYRGGRAAGNRNGGNRAADSYGGRDGEHHRENFHGGQNRAEEYRGNGAQGANRRGNPRVGAVYHGVPAPQHVSGGTADLRQRADVPPTRRANGGAGLQGADGEFAARRAGDGVSPARGYDDAFSPEPPDDFAPAPLPAEDENLLVGRNPIREALRAGRPVEKLLVARGDLSGAARDIVRMAREAGCVVQTVDRSRLDQIYPAHQGMLAYVAAADYKSVDDIFDYAASKGEDPFIVLLDGVTDPHNLGAIIRSAECAGAHGVILPERRAAGLGPAAAKAAAGALSYMRIARVKNLNRTIEELKARGVWVIGTAMDGEDALAADLSGPLALVIGSEGEGVSRLTLEKCDRTLTLPVKGGIESLNASVAAGILMYEVVRARAK